ncbi:MAG: Xaa-Pro dipeptidyl-peptidase, partial [Bacteroidetes bacterium]|nr:Xaa-Pro dipeptidyl-peptidase [Bacteroidota bacterium]
MKRTLLLVALALLIQPLWAQTGPVFENGMAQVVEAFSDESAWIREEVWVETEFDSDGDGALDRVHAAVVRQAQTETEGLQVPVIYGSSPYYAGTAGLADLFWDVRHEVGQEPPEKEKFDGFKPRIQPGISNGYVADWLPRGFAVVHSESPGTGLSQGCPTVGGMNESLAPKAVIDWLNGRAKAYTAPVGGEEIAAGWSTGNVGMTGTSYNGTLPLAAATTGVDGLKAIIPVAPNTSYWHYYRTNGLVRHPGGYLGEDIDVLYDFIHSQESDRRDYCNATIRDGEYVEGMDRATGDYNDFWAGRDYLNVIDNVKAATLMAHAFNDWNVMPEHSVRIVEALEGQVPVQMYYHQGGHGGPPPLDMMNKWFTRFLYDVENGVENDPKAWIVREGDERLEPTPYADYPHPESEGVRLFLIKGGQNTAALSLEQSPSQGVESLVDNVSFDGRSLATAEYTNHRLLYVTPALSQDVHISGTATMKVRLAASKPA